MKVWLLLWPLLYGACSQQETNEKITYDMAELNHNDTLLLETATFGGGCFWCSEAVFQKVRGVHSVVSGYSGGNIRNPSYREVTRGTTGHAEVIQIKFNPEEISYLQLLEIFFKTHDPTTLNRQGADVGTQYRSVIFFHNPQQKEMAENTRDALNREKIWNNPIVTEITEFSVFYKAEDYHQNYFANNPNQAYCQFVIIPKLDKMEKLFREQLK